jgi:hypothetical protein
MPRPQRTFPTSDTAFAAYLISHNIKFKQSKSYNPVIFELYDPDNNGTIGELAVAWDSGKAPGDCYAFFRAYKFLLREIKKTEAHEGAC